MYYALELHVRQWVKHVYTEEAILRYVTINSTLLEV